jgi:hypothetical protein
VIDWCGHRYQAQPSISESLIINPDRALVYGCLHDTDKFAADDETALRAARTLAARLHVKSVTHTTPAATEGDAPQTHQLPLGSYAKGVRGSDGRLYFLELGHTMPPDTTSSCPSAKHRPELVTLFHRDAMRVALAEKNAKAAAANKEKEGAAAAKGDATTDAPAATTDAPAVATTTTTTTTAAAAESTDATNATSAAAATTTTAPAAPAAAPVATGDAAATTTETPVADPKPEGSGAQDEFMHEFDLRLRASHVIVEHLSSTWTAWRRRFARSCCKTIRRRRR